LGKVTPWVFTLKGYLPWYLPVLSPKWVFTGFYVLPTSQSAKSCEMFEKIPTKIMGNNPVGKKVNTTKK